jgi:ATP-dependent Lon protease
MADQIRTQSLPVLPIRNTVLFPQTLFPLSVGRPSSIGAVQAAMSTEEKEIVVVAQRTDSAAETIKPEDLFSVGTKAIIRKMIRPSEGLIEVVVQGTERVTLLNTEQTDPFLKMSVRTFPLPEDTGPEVEATYRAVMELANKALSLAQPQALAELAPLLTSLDDPLRLVYMLGTALNLEVEKEQALLEVQTRLQALQLVQSYLNHEIQVLELRNKIAKDAQSEMTREQREYLLRQQMRAIQQELGEKSPEQSEINQLQEALAKADLPEEVRQEAERSISKLRSLPAMAPEYSVLRTYLEFVLELPWNKRTEDNLDIARARQILDEDHYDLKEIKERILEHLGVMKLNPGAKAPILCFVGAPGVGKTSLGQSIARAIGRKFERMSLGGLHDEAELRGHRRTYIGAMPGRIIKVIQRAGVNNPVLMLDEIDKLGRDFRGDPAAALLEILDPEQNRTFRDNFLELPFDLSKVFFITTANALDTIPQPLLDRMELLRLRGYSEEEKIEIAKKYLIPRQVKEAGLTSEQFQLTPEALHYIISRYTREAGLRQLERAIARLARKTALYFAEGKQDRVVIVPENLPEMLGPEPFSPEHARKTLPPGVATGLAWTETGGDVLYIEATLLPQGSGLTLTGQLGEVMQESARAAHSYIWSHALKLGIDRDTFRNSGVHIHVPAGAIPKDGPSAGVTMITALASLYTGHAARSDTAMTGEITLTGLILPVGGIKEKVLAARRAGIHRVILPAENRKDLIELPEDIRSEMEFVYVSTVEELLPAAIPELSKRFSMHTVP